MTLCVHQSFNTVSLPPKNSTVNMFFTFGDQLNKGTVNNVLISYLSNLYPDLNEFKILPIFSQLKVVAPIENYYFISKQKGVTL